jgi:pimeloyl-ACP methyl ester carboxylesterase
MIPPLLLALATLLPVPSALASPTQSNNTLEQDKASKRRGVRKQSRRISNAARQEALSNLMGSGNGTQQLGLGGTMTSGRRGPIITVGPSLAPGVYQLQLDDPGTGWQESVVLGLPQNPSAQAAPLLVMFHGADISEWDCYVNGTDMFEGARNKGWYVLAPLGAHQVNYGIPYSQENIEYALTLFCQLLPIDHERIYGVGFSMGGGTMMSYASRHMDPGKPRFAAVVNHTGTVSTANVYWNSQSTFIFDHPQTFNGSPLTFPFLYSQSSTVDIDPTTLAVNPNTDLGRNLSGVPVLNYHADFDPLSNLVAVTQTVFSWLGQIPGMETYLLTPPRNVHHWNTLDENTALNYLGSKRLETPTTGQHKVLADREARWLHFDVRQDLLGAFTPFRWNFEAQTNRLVIDQTENLQQLTVDTVSLGINTAVNLQLVMSSADGGSEITVLSGYLLQPQEVLRNGQPTQDWNWDSSTHAVTVTENNPGAGALWTIRP